MSATRDDNTRREPSRGARVSVQTAAFTWGLQFAFLNPALALLLSTQLHATDAQVGLALALYNASGFVASLIIPGWADRRRTYLNWMLVCGFLTLALAGVLAVSGSLSVAIVALIVLGGPAGVGSSLFFAHLRSAGFGPSDILSTRAMVSVAWVAGPPVAMLLAGWIGTRAVLAAIVVISLVGMGAILGMRRHGKESPASARTADDPSVPISKVRIAVIVTAFVALQATNATASSIMTLFTVNSLHLNAIWGGVALGVAALAEVPALMLLGRLTPRFGQVPLLLVGCVVGILFYVLMAIVHDPVTLIAAQLLNAWFFATVTGIGLTLFQDIIPRPGLASGLFTNTRRIGAVVAGGVIAIAGTSLGFPGVFTACAILTALALMLVIIVWRSIRIRQKVQET
ncbi:MFS transporter [Microbacterium sp. B2969]|uniref:MFS transporter n=1 Tax=Microbacterium alkaliflavum TaxID=3248839 RepID=A0ABW7QDV0_9MICO